MSAPPAARSWARRLADARRAAILTRLSASQRRHAADTERAVDALLDVIRAAERGEPTTLVVKATGNGRLFAEVLVARTHTP